MKQVPSLRSLDSVVAVSLGAALIVAAVTLFQEPIAQLIMGLLGAWFLLEGVTGTCLLFRRYRVKSFAEAMAKEPLLPLLFIQFLLAYEWWKSGWAKLINPEYLSGFTATLTSLASQNPFSWMRALLLGEYAANAGWYAVLVVTGELLAATALIIGAAGYLYLQSAHMRFAMLTLSCMALTGLLLLNAVFYFAAGWMGPSTSSINVVLFGVQAVLLYAEISVLSENRVKG